MRYQQLGLLPLLLLGQRFRVARHVLGVGHFEGQFHERSPQTLHFLLDCIANVVGRHARAQSPRRGNGLESGHSGTQHEHAGRPHRSSRRGQQREKLGQQVGRNKHGSVAGYGRHRRERVHFLRPRNARHQLHGQRRHPLPGQFFGDFGTIEWAQKSDIHASRAQQRNFLFRRGLHVNHQLGRPGFLPGHDPRPGSFVLRVGNERTGSCSPLHPHTHPLLREALHHIGHQRNPSFTGDRFGRNANLQRHPFLWIG